jgi:hypothetical protein
MAQKKKASKKKAAAKKKPLKRRAKAAAPARAPRRKSGARMQAAKPAAERKAAPKRAVERVSEDLDLVFRELKDMLGQYASALRVQADKAGTYYLNTLRDDMGGKPHFFGGARKGRNYVSLYLMPVYEFADLLATVPADLRDRMQGKSCFNFKTLSEIPREELRRLMDAAVERVKTVVPSAAA